MRTPVVPAGPCGPTGTGDLSSGETSLSVDLRTRLTPTRRRSTAASSTQEPIESSDARLPDGRGTGRGRVAALAGARRGGRSCRPRRALPLRPLPGDRKRVAGGLARCLDDPRGARRTHAQPPARGDGPARPVPAGFRGSQEGRGRPPP